MLSHTGDPNKGLRDWYENRKHQNNEEEAENEAPTEGKINTEVHGWNFIRNRFKRKKEATERWGSVSRNILDGKVLRGVGSMAKTKVRHLVSPHAVTYHINTLVTIPCIFTTKTGLDTKNINQLERPASALPAKVAMDLKQIREKHKKKLSENYDPSIIETNNNKERAPHTLPVNVTNDLKRIRERRAQKVETATNDDSPAINDSPAIKEQSSVSGLPPNVAADLQRIHVRHTRKSARVGQSVAKGKRNDRPRPSAKKATVHKNKSRQRQAGSMFFKSGAHKEGAPKGWLEQRESK